MSDEWSDLHTLATTTLTVEQVQKQRGAAARSSYPIVTLERAVSRYERDVYPLACTATVKVSVAITLETYIGVMLVQRMGGRGRWLVCDVTRDGFTLSRRLIGRYSENAVWQSSTKVLNALLSRALQWRVKRLWAAGKARHREVFSELQKKYNGE